MHARLVGRAAPRLGVAMVAADRRTNAVCVGQDRMAVQRWKPGRQLLARHFRGQEWNAVVMGAFAPRDWTEQHDGPPPLADATVLVLPDRRLLWRAGVPTGVVGALVIWGGWFSTARVGTFVGGIIVIALSAARTLLWARGFGTRRLLSTPTHLVMCRRDVPEQWVAWSALDRLVAHRGPRLPEWSRNGGMWFFVAPEPALAILPPRAVVGGFGEMLIPHRATEAAIERLRADASSHHVTIDVR